MLVTANTPSVASTLGPGLIPGALSTDPALWASALARLYGGNASNVVINGEQLALLGFQFGSDSQSGSLYLEPAFQPVGAGHTLPECVAPHLSHRCSSTYPSSTQTS
jgi:hypothetical protein